MISLYPIQNEMNHNESASVGDVTFTNGGTSKKENVLQLTQSCSSEGLLCFHFRAKGKSVEP